MDHFLKSLLNSLHYQFGFMFWFSDRRECGISTPWPGIEPTPFALEGKVWTTGLPGKSLLFSFLIALYILPSHLTTFSKKPRLTAPLEIAITTLLYPSPSFSIAIIHNFNRLCNLLIMSIVCLFPLEHKLSKGGNIYWFYSLTQLSQEPKTVLGIW